MTVAVVTDSAAAIPPALVERHGITVVPMWLSVDGEPVPEGQRPLGELLGDARVTTSAPTPGEFEAAIRAALAAGASDVLVLTIASAMSASHDAAAVAAREVGDHARVVDTKTAAGAQALVVLAAARAAAAGAPLDAVTAAALDVVSRACAWSPPCPTSTTSCAADGYRGSPAGPVARSASARCSSSGPARCAASAPRSGSRPPTTASWRVSGARRPPEHAPTWSPSTPSRRTPPTRCSRAVGETAAVESFTSEFGSVMVVHAGPGLVGLAWWWEPVSPGDPPG